MSHTRRQYPFHLIEPKWQRFWDGQKTFRAWNPGDTLPEKHPFAIRHGLANQKADARTLTNNGTLTVSWDDPGGTNQTLADGSTFFALHFEVVGALGARSQVFIDGSPTPIEAAIESTHVLAVAPTAGEVTVGSTIAPSPMVLPLTLNALDANGALSLWWNSVAGRIYRVEYTDDLATNDWQPLDNDVVASGSTATVAVPAESEAPRFYRVLDLGLTTPPPSSLP